MEVGSGCLVEGGPMPLIPTPLLCLSNFKTPFLSKGPAHAMSACAPTDLILVCLPEGCGKL